MSAQQNYFSKSRVETFSDGIFAIIVTLLVLEIQVPEISNHHSKQELLNALEKISAGGIYFSEEVLEEMTKASQLKKVNLEVNLTGREVEIIKLIEKEYSNKLIADSLFLSERTIETHRKNIFRKTKTNSVLGLIKYAYEHKLA